MTNADGIDLTPSPEHDFVPDWSPDGNRIVTAGTEDGDCNLYVAVPDGSGPAKLFDGDVDVGSPSEECWLCEG